MRLFIAIELPDDTKADLARVRADIPGAVWSKPNTYHLTLRFLGDGIDESRVPPLTEALAAIRVDPFSFTLRGVGRFPPNPKQAPRVLWIGVDAPPELHKLYQQVESAVTGLGFPPDDHPFSGHITLARLKSGKPSPEADRFIATYAALESDPIGVKAFYLISSQLTPSGAVYTHVASFPLKSAS